MMQYWWVCCDTHGYGAVEWGGLGVIRPLFLMVRCGSRYCCGMDSFQSTVCTNVGGRISCL